MEERPIWGLQMGLCREVLSEVGFGFAAPLSHAASVRKEARLHFAKRAFPVEAVIQ